METIFPCASLVTEIDFEYWVATQPVNKQTDSEQMVFIFILSDASRKKKGANPSHLARWHLDMPVTRIRRAAPMQAHNSAGLVTVGKVSKFSVRSSRYANVSRPIQSAI